jgi:hypothetical protein
MVATTLDEGLHMYQVRRALRGETGLVHLCDYSRSRGEARLSWVVRGDLGAVEFHMCPDRDWYEDPHRAEVCAGVEKHDPCARYANAQPLPWECRYVFGSCYPDGSSMLGEELLNIYGPTPERLARCTQDIFFRLERTYEDWFERVTN